jgi:hypothetical protein
MDLIHVEFYRMLGCVVYLSVIRSTPARHGRRADSLSYNSTKPGTLHGHACIRPSTNGHNLITDVLPLSITVRPNHQSLCTSGLLLQVLLYVLLISRDRGLDIRFKEVEWVTAVPGLELRTKVLIHEMSGNRGDGVLGSGLRVIKIIVLDELRGSVALSKV